MSDELRESATSSRLAEFKNLLKDASESERAEMLEMLSNTETKPKTESLKVKTKEAFRERVSQILKEIEEAGNKLGLSSEIETDSLLINSRYNNIRGSVEDKAALFNSYVELANFIHANAIHVETENLDRDSNRGFSDPKLTTIELTKSGIFDNFKSAHNGLLTFDEFMQEREKELFDLKTQKEAAKLEHDEKIKRAKERGVAINPEFIFHEEYKIENLPTTKLAQHLKRALDTARYPLNQSESDRPAEPNLKTALERKPLFTTKDDQDRLKLIEDVNKFSAEPKRTIAKLQKEYTDLTSKNADLFKNGQIPNSTAELNSLIESLENRKKQLKTEFDEAELEHKRDIAQLNSLKPKNRFSLEARKPSPLQHSASTEDVKKQLITLSNLDANKFNSNEIYKTLANKYGGIEPYKAPITAIFLPENIADSKSAEDYLNVLIQKLSDLSIELTTSEQLQQKLDQMPENPFKINDDLFQLDRAKFSKIFPEFSADIHGVEAAWKRLNSKLKQNIKADAFWKAMPPDPLTRLIDSPEEWESLLNSFFIQLITDPAQRSKSILDSQKRHSAQQFAGEYLALTVTNETPAKDPITKAEDSDASRIAKKFLVVNPELKELFKTIIQEVKGLPETTPVRD